MFYKGKKVDHSDLVMVHNTLPCHDVLRHQVWWPATYSMKNILQKGFPLISYKGKKVDHSDLVTCMIHNTLPCHEVLPQQVWW